MSVDTGAHAAGNRCTPQNITKAVVLAGGRGTRLGALTDNMPKPLLPVAGVPFLEYVLWNLARWGITEIILSIGWRADAIQGHFGDGASFGVHITYAAEPSPLGTGGAIRFAASALTEPFFVVNGDTLLDCEFHVLADLTFRLGAKAGMALRQVEDAGRFGSVSFSEHRVHGFHEKGIAGPGLINGGVYFLTPEAMRLLPDGPSSLETEFFPMLVKQGDLAGLICGGFFLDMGLPATYTEAQTLLPEWKKKATIRAVFLDRDGTLIVEKNYLHDPEQIELLPGVIEGLKLLRQYGFALIMVTNQSGVGRGYYSLEAMHAVNKRLGDILRAEDVELDAVYYCPHTPDEGCGCRKPETGMLRQAVHETGICLPTSFVVGDKEADISLGNNAGMRTVLVRTGYGAETERQGASSPSYVSDTLYDAAWWIAQNRNTQNESML